MIEKIKELYAQLMTYKVVKKVVFAVEFFTTKGVITAASALTYSTILAIVPICAVLFAIARGFGFSIHIEEWFRNALSSQPQAAEVIIGFVNSYLIHTKSGIILGIGLLFMLYTVLMLARNVEQTFNDIWHVRNRKNLMRTFTDYLAIFFLIPILIIVMSGVSLFVATIGSQMSWMSLLGPVMQLLVDLVPFLLMWLAFTALYVFMPNTWVKVKCAIIPGLLAAVAMTCLQWFYIHAQMFISNYNAIYGSFAALPLFMLWVQFSWTICLFGAELTYTNQNLEDFAHADGAKMLSQRYKVLISCVLMSRICKRFANGEPPYSASQLKTETDIPASVINDLLLTLVKLNLLTESINPAHPREVFYQPALSLDKITMGMVQGRLESYGHCSFSFEAKDLLHECEEFSEILRLRKEHLDKLDDFKLVDL